MGSIIQSHFFTILRVLSSTAWSKIAHNLVYNSVQWGRVSGNGGMTLASKELVYLPSTCIPLART